MDKAASETTINFMFGWFLNPVMKGDYPDIMKRQIERKSAEQNLEKSRLPVFTEKEKSFIRGRSNDVCGQNCTDLILAF